MNYTALYRQFRPQNFVELIGQDHISRTLLNSITGDKIAHAYLFSGPRGTGKTSAAKIFAKAINCLDSQQGEPCNKCINCVKITEGSSFDVLEIDAASNRGIDEIRDLREKVKYAPAEGKYKVYIIDEVHMLTTEAFNALLKTLEEPPKHIVFILATTEPHKLLPTIISRCQRFDFKRITFALLLEQLRQVSAQVGITVDEKALFVIAKKAEGGMRDALSLLDQTAAYGNGVLSYETVLEVLGSVQETELLSLLKALLDQEAAQILLTVEGFVAEGKDLKLVLHELQDVVRSVILVKLFKKKPETMDEDFYKAAQKLEPQDDNQLYNILEVLAETENTMKYAAQARITFEVGLLRTVNKFSRQVTSEPKVHKENPVREGATVYKAPELDKIPASAVPSETKTVSAIPKEKPVTEGIKAAWEKLLDEVKKHHKVLYAFFMEGNPVAFSENSFTIEFDSSREFHFSQVNKTENVKILQQISHKLYGENMKLEVKLSQQKKEKALGQKVQEIFGKDIVEFVD